MAEVFTRTQLDCGGSMSADHGVMTLSGGLSPVLMQSVGLQYAQQVTRIYELGELGETANMYYVGGRSQGNCSIAQVVGPPTQLAAFFERYGDVCMACCNSIQLALDNSCEDTGCGTLEPPDEGDSGGANMTLNFVVLTQIGLAVAAQDLIISQQNQLMFSGLDYTGN